MKLIPVHTEKSMKEAKNGNYTFAVGPFMTKNQIAELVKNTFGVNVTKVTTTNYKANVKRNMYGKTVSQKGYKKAVVSLKKGEKIEIFDTKEDKKNK